MNESNPITVPSPSETELLKKPAPTFYGIILFKIVKGCIFLTLAIMAYTLSDNDLPAEYQKVLHFFRVHPGNKFFQNVAIKVGELTETKMLWAAVGTLAYSMFALVEGIGMAFRVSWAGWLAIGESAFFVPIEIYALVEHPSIRLFVVLVINIIIVVYLFKNRQRLFRHHLHHGAH
jgi:uncharacterized membrane protein (DUF2068 family)